MRITGGIVQGRNLAGPKAKTRKIRPTSDRVREALFNILAGLIPGRTVLDLFAGTGALGIETLSRGAAVAVFVDQDVEALELVRTNLMHCFDQPNAYVYRINLSRRSGLQKLKSKIPPNLLFDLVFIDPPYQKNLAEKMLVMVEKAGILSPNAHVIVEERHTEHLPDHVGSLIKKDQRRYGETGIWIYTSLPDF